jgi:hypothetical protein
MNSYEVLAVACAYLDDRRVPLPPKHALAVALCEVADDRDRLRFEVLKATVELKATQRQLDGHIKADRDMSEALNSGNGSYRP